MLVQATARKLIHGRHLYFLLIYANKKYSRFTSLDVYVIVKWFFDRCRFFDSFVSWQIRIANFFLPIIKAARILILDRHFHFLLYPIRQTFTLSLLLDRCVLSNLFIFNKSSLLNRCFSLYIFKQLKFLFSHSIHISLNQVWIV